MRAFRAIWPLLVLIGLVVVAYLTMALYADLFLQPHSGPLRGS